MGWVNTRSMNKVRDRIEARAIFKVMIGLELGLGLGLSLELRLRLGQD